MMRIRWVAPVAVVAALLLSASAAARDYGYLVDADAY